MILWKRLNKEDRGVWQRRDTPYIEPRKQPFCMGVNMRGARWCGYKYYFIKAKREDRAVWLQINTLNRSFAAKSEGSK